MTSLFGRAREAIDDAHAPYSGYKVGAALETVDGKVFTGCNVENANYSNSIHAEELAIGQAISSGYRDFDRLALVSEGGDGVIPCGKCRQTLAEFCSDDFEILCGGGENTATYTLGELLPEAFRDSYLDNGR